jgi:hypothetical protein
VECPGPVRFSVESYQTFKEELISTLLKLFYEIERKVALSNSFYEAHFTPIPKPDQETSKKVNYRPVSLTNIDATTLNIIKANKSNNISERAFTMTKSASSHGCRDASTYKNE